MSTFADMRVLLATVGSSFLAFFWSMSLLFVAMLVYAMVMCQVAHPYLMQEGEVEQHALFLYEYYGTAGRSLWTAFEMTFSGSWPQHLRLLIENVSVTFGIVGAIYISAVAFALTRIITAIFLKDTLAACNNDAELVAQQKMAERRECASKLLEIFEEADTSGSGILTLNKFEALLANPAVKAFMAAMGLETHESKNLFGMLDDGDGLITAEEFVEGALHLKGTARSRDVIAIMHSFNKLQARLDSMHGMIIELSDKRETSECAGGGIGSF
jgi:hypothetical protein